jgi:membrane protein implicated in regulation of membrane protease activity
MTLVIGGFSESIYMVPVVLGFAVVYALVLLRFGFLALIMTSICARLLLGFARTPDFSLWYAGIGAAPLVIVALIAVWGFRAATGEPEKSQPARAAG